MPIECVAAFGMGLRVTAIISLHKMNMIYGKLHLLAFQYI
jgi:hypothetical protein